MSQTTVNTDTITEKTGGTDEHTDLSKKKTRDKVIGSLLLGSIASFSLLAGFGATLSSARKQDPASFAKGLTSFSEKGLSETGGALAFRALGKATLYTFGIFGIATFVVARLMGVHNIHEFYVKVDSMVPKFPKKESTGRQDFESIRELFQYIIDEDEKEKNKKK